MALFAKLLGRRSFEDLKAEADRLREAGEYGQAKLVYDRAGDARDAPAGAREAMRRQADACRDAIAETRLGEAQRLLSEGQLDLALFELDHARETAASPQLLERIRDASEHAQRAEVRDQLEDRAEELDEDGRYEALGGSWEIEQHAEYVGYGQPFKRALLQLNDGESKAARDLLEDLVGRADDAHYLWFEVARARLAAGDDRGAEQAFSTFLSRIGPEEGGDTRLTAHMTLAALRNEAGDVEGAIGHYQDALEAMPEDPRTYLAMGALLRQQGLADEALDVLNSGLAVLDEGQPHFRLWLECGLANAAAGHAAQARHWLERVVEFFAQRQHFDLPPEGALCLAKLHEEDGNLARAADLYRMLAEGSDAQNLLEYHRQAARVLATLQQPDQARRMLVRARELVPPEDAAALAALDAELQKLA